MNVRACTNSSTGLQLSNFSSHINYGSQDSADNKMNCELMLTYDTPAHVHICSMCIKTNQVGKQEVGMGRIQKRFPRYGVPI